MNPNAMNPALIGALTGAGGLGLAQLLRKMTQSKKDEEENGSPSVLNGALLGALLGGGAGAGLPHLQKLMQQLRPEVDHSHQRPNSHTERLLNSLMSGGGIPGSYDMRTHQRTMGSLPSNLRRPADRSQTERLMNSLLTGPAGGFNLTSGSRRGERNLLPREAEDFRSTTTPLAIRDALSRGLQPEMGGPSLTQMAVNLLNRERQADFQTATKARGTQLRRMQQELQGKDVVIPNADFGLGQQVSGVLGNLFSRPRDFASSIGDYGNEMMSDVSDSLFSAGQRGGTALRSGANAAMQGVGEAADAAYGGLYNAADSALWHQPSLPPVPQLPPKVAPPVMLDANSLFQRPY